MSNSENDGYTVGYKKPPRHTRFKPGQSGNTRGRRPKTKAFDAILDEQLDAPIEVTTKHGKTKVSTREALARRIVHDAIKGSTKHLEFLVRHMRENGGPDPFVITPADHETMASLLAGMVAPQAAVDGEQGPEEGSHGDR